MNTTALRHFVRGLTDLVSRAGADEHAMLNEGAALLRRLIATDDWLPPQFALPNPAGYGQYLLHCDPYERFSVVSFVWSPGQQTPVHDHTVWGLVGVLRGEEITQSFVRVADAQQLEPGECRSLRPGDIEMLSPQLGDVHQVSCGERGVAVSIHVYGANIGTCERRTFDPLTGASRPFISGYSNTVLPNVWS